MKVLIVALLLAAIVPATAQRRPIPAEPQSSRMDFGPPSRTIKMYDKDKKEVIATATFSQRAIYFHDLNGKHFATIARNPDNSIGAWDPKGQPIDPKVLPLPSSQ